MDQTTGVSNDYQVIMCINSLTPVWHLWLQQVWTCPWSLVGWCSYSRSYFPPRKELLFQPLPWLKSGEYRTFYSQLFMQWGVYEFRGQIYIIKTNYELSWDHMRLLVARHKNWAHILEALSKVKSRKLSRRVWVSGSSYSSRALLLPKHKQ